MINIKDAIEKYPQCTKSKELFSGVLKDLYPEQKNRVEIKVLTDLFSVGILDHIKNNSINDLLIESYLYSLESNYGYSSGLIYRAIYLWLSAYSDTYPDLSHLLNKFPQSSITSDEGLCESTSQSNSIQLAVKKDISQVYTDNNVIRSFGSEQKKIIGLFNECKYKNITLYYADNFKSTQFDYVMFAYGKLFVGEYDEAIALCDKLDSITGKIAKFTEDDLRKYKEARTTSKKIDVLFDNIPNTAELIRNFAISAKELSEFDTLAQQHSTNGKGRIKYQSSDISGYFELICKRRNTIPSMAAHIDDIRQWIYEDCRSGDEKLAYATAEYFFGQKNYVIAAYCYYYAISINCVNPLYYAYFAQCMLRGNRITDGGLMAGHIAYKIAIYLDPDNAKWRVMHATLLSHIQMCTPFNVRKIRSQAIRFADECSNKTAADCKSIERLQNIEWNEGI